MNLTPTDWSYIQDLDRVAAHSDDPDTQTACILVSPTGRGVRMPNVLPPGLALKPERVSKPNKYLYICHAERMAVYGAARYGFAMAGATAYLNWFPCAACAQALVATGITRLVANITAYEARKDDPRYDFALAMEHLVEADVRIDWYTPHALACNVLSPSDVTAACATAATTISAGAPGETAIP